MSILIECDDIMDQDDDVIIILSLSIDIPGLDDNSYDCGDNTDEHDDEEDDAKSGGELSRMSV